MNITDETIAKAIQIEWAVAMAAETRHDWQYRWTHVHGMVCGMWDLVLQIAPVDHTRNQRDSLTLLRLVSMHNILATPTELKRGAI